MHSVYLRMIQLTQEFLLVHHRVNGTLRNDTSLQHFFHGKQLGATASALDHLPDLAEAATTNDVFELEVGLGQLYKNT